VTGTAMVASLHFATSTYPLHLGRFIVPGYAALYSLVVNLAVAAGATLVLDALGFSRAADETSPADYQTGADAATMSCSD
jgi:solute:Na+ symporter, SSS family